MPGGGFLAGNARRVCTARGNGTQLQPVVIKRGQLDTTLGLLATGDEAIQKLQQTAADKRVRNAEETAQQAHAELKFEQERENRRREREHFERCALKHRISAYGDPNVLPRPLKLRAAVAKELNQARRAANTASEHAS